MTSLSIEEALQLAIGHHQAGRLTEAEAIYQSILQQVPGNAQALQLLGVLTGQLRKHDLAVMLIRQAIAADPANPSFHSNMSSQLAALGRWEEAVAASLCAIELRPERAESWVNLAHARRGKGDLQGAIVACREAIRLRPDFATAYAQLGIALRRFGDVHAAIVAYKEALRLAPANPQTWNDLGIAFASVRQFDEAIASFQEALRLSPNFGQALNNLGTALKEIGRLRDSTTAYERAIELDPAFSPAYNGLIFTLLFRPDIAPGCLQEVLASFNRRFAEPLRSFIRPPSNDRSPERRLRIGYVSADFRSHVIARNVLPLMHRHDRQKFELFFYSSTAEEDDYTDTFRQLADKWRTILSLSDEQVAEQIRSDVIDILVDLSLHTVGNRLLVFGRKPAPIQVTFAGYPGSTGLDTIDYRLTDPWLDPASPESGDRAYVEKSVRLAHTFWCYESQGEPPAVAPLPALANGYTTFGCLNSFFKINDGVLCLWACVMAEVQGSRLLVHVPEGSARTTFLTTMQSRGIDSSRITFVPRLAQHDYFRLYNTIDIFLDTVPYNAHTTALDSLFMGVPVVTLVGETVVGRAGLSQLTNLGRREWIAQTSEQYVQIASNLAADVQRLAQIRAQLRERMEKSALMDADGFTRAIESAYRAMWKKWCESPAP